MRGESLEPGGCSVWPTSALAAWSIACAPPPPEPGPPTPPSVGEKAVVVMPGVAFGPGTAAVWAPSAAWNDELDGTAWAGTGTSARSISAIRAITLSTLIHRGGRPVGARL